LDLEGISGANTNKDMERQHLILAIASFLVALAWIPHRADATASLKLSVASHPRLQDRTAEMMAMIRMVDVADRNLNEWIPTFERSWEAYQAKTTKEPKKWYCQKYADLEKDLANLISQAGLVRQGIHAKRTQINQIKDILSNTELNGKSGLHCEADSEEPICEILASMESVNDQEELQLDRYLAAIENEEINVARYVCNCEMDAWSEYDACSKTCGQGTHKRTREIKWNLRNGGNPCPPAEETKSCEDQCCPVDCVYGKWGPWSACDEKCDGKEHLIERTRHVVTPTICGGKTCEEVYKGEGKTQSKPCNILQVKADKVIEWEGKISALEGQLHELKGKYCSPNPCEHSTTCTIGEVTDKESGFKHPVAQCNCGDKYTGNWCGTAV